MRKTEKMTKAQAINWNHAVDAHRMIEHDLHAFLARELMVPPAWDQIWKERDRRDTTRVSVTMRLDADVVKFFKAMGEGYQPRINRVLRTYMYYRLAGIVQGPDTTDYVLRPENVRTQKNRRPRWGDFDASIGRTGDTGGTGETGEAGEKGSE